MVDVADVPDAIADGLAADSVNVAGGVTTAVTVTVAKPVADA